MDIETIKKTVDDEKRGFKDRYHLEPNSLIINDSIYEEMLSDARKLIKKYTVADVQSSDIEMAIKKIAHYRGLRILIINAVKQPTVGYIEFKDVGLVSQIIDADSGKKVSEDKPAESTANPPAENKAKEE